MGEAIGGGDLVLLEGSQCTIGGERYVFEASKDKGAAFLMGGEGLVVPITSMRSNERFMLKLLKTPSSERQRRMKFLSRLGLSEIWRGFEGCPRTVIHETLALPVEDEVREFDFSGHISRRVDGITWREAVAYSGWVPSTEARVRLAAELCTAIRILEHCQIVHGDIQSKNVMVRGVRSGETPSLALVDFDGFHHPRVPLIPFELGRPLGAHGYRHGAYRNLDRDVVVTSDRCAMAILAFEIVAYRSSTSDEDDEPSIISQDNIDRFDPTVPDDVIDRWPAGYELLRRAITCGRPEEGPSPEEWLDALEHVEEPAAGHISGVSLATTDDDVPRLVITEKDQEETRVNLRRAANTLGAVHEQLRWLSYQRNGDAVILHGVAPSKAYIDRGHGFEKCDSEIDLDLRPGDIFRWGMFDIERL